MALWQGVFVLIASLRLGISSAFALYEGYDAYPDSRRMLGHVKNRYLPNVGHYYRFKRGENVALFAASRQLGGLTGPFRISYYGVGVMRLGEVNRGFY